MGGEFVCSGARTREASTCVALLWLPAEGVAGEEDKEEEMGKAYTDAGDTEGDADMGEMR